MLMYPLLHSTFGFVKSVKNVVVSIQKPSEFDYSEFIFLTIPALHVKCVRNPYLIKPIKSPEGIAFYEKRGGGVRGLNVISQLLPNTSYNK